MFVSEIRNLFVVKVLEESHVDCFYLIDDFFNFGFVKEVEKTFHDV